MMKPKERIYQAFLHLQFAIKLFCFFENGHVQKEQFDCVTEIQTAGELLQYPQGAFHTDQDLILAAQNVYSTALGVCAIALESALQDYGVMNDPQDMSEKGALRSFVYQIRNAFAHDAMFPRWSVKGAYQRVFDLRRFGIPILIDLSQLDGESLELEQFGGMRGFETLRDAVLRWVLAGDPTVSPLIVNPAH